MSQVAKARHLTLSCIEAYAVVCSSIQGPKDIFSVAA